MTPDTVTQPPPTHMKAVPVRHYGRWIGAAVVVWLVYLVGSAILTSPNLEPATIWHYLFQGFILDGVRTTLVLTAVAMLFGTGGGILLAVMRLSANPVLRAAASAFVWFFRGTPLLVQIVFFGFLGALLPRITVTVPFIDITVFDEPTSLVVNGTVAALLALSLNEMAYAAEIVRGGILAVDKGQSEAAHALGMTPGLTMRRIVLPQAMRVIVPPMGNEVITMLKSTALVSVIAGQDLMTAVQSVYGQNFKVMPLLAVAAIWYLILVSALSVIQYFIERRFGRGHQPARGGMFR